jgi:hypothetical protein
MPPYTSNSIFCNYEIKSNDEILSNNNLFETPISPKWTVKKFISIIKSRFTDNINIYLDDTQENITPSDLNITTILGKKLNKKFIIEYLKNVQTLKSISDINNQIDQLCCICLNNSIEVTFRPCNHSITCYNCSTHNTITTCPICRCNIEKIIFFN